MGLGSFKASWWSRCTQKSKATAGLLAQLFASFFVSCETYFRWHNAELAQLALRKQATFSVTKTLADGFDGFNSQKRREAHSMESWVPCCMESIASLWAQPAGSILCFTEAEHNEFGSWDLGKQQLTLKCGNNDFNHGSVQAANSRGFVPSGRRGVSLASSKRVQQDHATKAFTQENSQHQSTHKLLGQKQLKAKSVVFLQNQLANQRPPKTTLRFTFSKKELLLEEPLK